MEREVGSIEPLDAASNVNEHVPRIAERVGAVARAATVFAEPVEREGVTVVPVAKLRWGFGGGMGARRREGAEGGGGGGGVIASPVGFIELRDGQARFRPVVDPAGIAVAGAFGLVAGLVVARLLRG
jgi:uncharacterized spore protein YtfJ